MDSGMPISMPVGEGVMGRVFDVTGNPVDERGPVEAEKYYPSHRPATPLVGTIDFPPTPADRDQGNRFDLPFPEGGQGGRVSAALALKDGRHHGADQ